MTFQNGGGRVEAFDEGNRVGILDFDIDGTNMVIVHTRVAETCRGKGVGMALLKAALAAAEARRWKVSPVCSFARVYFERHGELSSLRADDVASV